MRTNSKLKTLTSYFLLLTSKKGFTLIELLIVITILGILMTIGYQSFYRSQEKARDAERKSDLRQIQKALELYEQDQPLPAYPDDLDDLESPTEYMKEVPSDPMIAGGWDDYSYTHDSQLEYTLFACLENEDDADSDVANGKPERCTDAGAVSYTITEP
jgi:general secretion pathway protein G